MIAAAIFIFTNMSKDVSTYGSFSDAMQNESRVKIVGELARDKDMIYDPQNEPNRFTFFLNDEKGVQKQVLLLKPKPQDFERSEKVVLTGSMKDNVFVADEILMKCPSKYKEEEISIKSDS